MALFKKNDKKEYRSVRNTPEENDLLNKIDSLQRVAEGGKRDEIVKRWDDEYKMYQGGGKQWDTSMAMRSERGKKRNFNSEDNFILPMVQNMLAPFSIAPTMEASAVEEGDREAGKVIGDLIPHILYRNKFPNQYRKITTQMVQYGPVIGHVSWDQNWIGGSGPNRWVGEIRVQYVKKDIFYPDPAIIDLEERLQECNFINLVERKKLSWFADTWDKGKYVIEDIEGIIEGQENEGQDPNQAALITHFHKGTPKFVSKEWKKEFEDKAEEAERNGLPYKAMDYRDMAKGILKGVHCAYKANDILLDYIPYIYDDGLYPFGYKVLYEDEKQPWGMGEIRNVIMPQLTHNKADEIELGAMLGQGLGGGFYRKGALSNSQRDELLDNIARPNAWHEVNDIHAIEEKKAVQVPASITRYKSEKKTVIDTVSGNTAILQGISPGANVPYSTIAELGARADARTRRKAKVLEDFMIDITKLIINRIAQFYTEERKYRILGDAKRMQEETYNEVLQIANMPQGTPPNVQLQEMIDLMRKVKTEQEPKTGTFRRDMLVRTWDREQTVDEEGNIVLMKEEFIPEFDIRAKVMESRPTDRNYYINLALQLLGKAMGIKCFWKTVDEGVFPPVDEILAELEEMQQKQMEAQQMALQAQQQGSEAEHREALEKIALQGQMMERQVAISAAGRRGNVSGEIGR